MNIKHTRPDPKLTLLLFILLFLWVFLLRSPTFLRSVIDWDESLYLIMAKEWGSGNLPYTTAWDNKPIGIYVIFNIALTLFGDSVNSIRMIAIIFVYATSVTLLFLSKQLFKSNMAGIISAVTYPVFSLGFDGLASNTELFFIFFNITGFLFLIYVHSGNWATGKRYIYSFISGLFFGIALQIKYIVIFEVIFLMLASFFVGNTNRRSGRNLKDRIYIIILLGSGALAPTCIAFLYYFYHNALGDFLEANFIANQRLISTTNSLFPIIPDLLKSAYQWLLWVFPVIMIVLFSYIFIDLREDRTPNKNIRILIFFFLWICVTLLESWITRKFYRHYYLVTLPPLCLILSYSLLRLNIQFLSRARIVSMVFLIIFLPLIKTGIKYRSWFRDYTKYGKDSVAMVSDYIRENISERDYIFVLNYEPIIYFMTGARFPTKYVFPPFIIDPFFSKVANLDYKMEVNNILKLYPKFIVTRDTDSVRVKEIIEEIKNDYFVDKIFGEITIYKIRSDILNP